MNSILTKLRNAQFEEHLMYNLPREFMTNLCDTIHSLRRRENKRYTNCKQQQFEPIHPCEKTSIMTGSSRNTLLVKSALRAKMAKTPDLNQV